MAAAPPLLSDCLWHIALALPCDAAGRLAMSCAHAAGVVRGRAFLEALARAHGVAPGAARSLEALAVAAACAALLRPGDATVYFERCSDVVRRESRPAFARVAPGLARLLARHHPRLALEVDGHCGRGCPETVFAEFTRERARAVCRALRAHAGADAAPPPLWYCGCGKAVAAVDIAHLGGGDYSTATLRLALRRGDDALWSWGAREWWRVGPTGEPDASLARPEYARYDEAAESDDDDDDDGYDYGDGTTVATRLGIA